MDNLCHTLAGAALGEAGLKRRTRFGSAALMISANLPDVDVLALLSDAPTVAFRRGWTHGIGAQLLLPIALTAACWAMARLRPAPMDAPPLRLGWLLLLSYVGVYSHVFLDYLNTYGVRLLTPIEWRWFYGDALFIIDPWLWLALGAGVWLSRRRSRVRPARVALVAAAVYIAAMLISARVARGIVADAWQEARGRPPAALMVGPLPLVPFAREVIVDAGDHYEVGRFDWLSRRVEFGGAVPKNDTAAAVTAARADARIRGFLVWSRFPFWQVQQVDGETRVELRDMRFRGGGARFSESTVVRPQ